MVKSEVNLADIRREYGELSLDEKEVLASPFLQFEEWFKEAQAHEIDDPTAMVLSTVDQAGFPNARVVLLKGIVDQAFIFYTHYDSIKGREILAHPKVALTFYWPKLCRQVRIRGVISQVSSEESDAYFKTRPLLSQLSALASHQSQPLSNRQELEEKYQALIQTYKRKCAETARMLGWICRDTTRD